MCNIDDWVSGARATAEGEQTSSPTTPAHRPAKAGSAAYDAARAARSAGKVVFFAKHVDVMDAARRPPDEGR